MFIPLFPPLLGAEPIYSIFNKKFKIPLSNVSVSSTEAIIKGYETKVNRYSLAKR